MRHQSFFPRAVAFPLNKVSNNILLSTGFNESHHAFTDLCLARRVKRPSPLCAPAVVTFISPFGRLGLFPCPDLFRGTHKRVVLPKNAQGPSPLHYFRKSLTAYRAVQ